MSARIKAAAKASEACAAGHDNWDNLPSWRQDCALSEATVALTAADAVMFNEAAVERAAKALAGVDDWSPDWPEDFRNKYREIALRMIAALKE